jgi:hypothetical protein
MDVYNVFDGPTIFTFYESTPSIVPFRSRTSKQDLRLDLSACQAFALIEPVATRVQKFLEGEHILFNKRVIN